VLTSLLNIKAKYNRHH